MLADCPLALRRQRLATLRLARAYRANDKAEAAAAATRAELDAAFCAWAPGNSTSREKARTMLEMAGLVERQRLCATSIVEDAGAAG